MMKIRSSSILACLAGSILIISPAFGNHRTGSFALPELLVSADFNQDGNLDLAANVTGFDNVAIFFGDGQGGLTLNGHIASDTLTKGLDVADIDGDRHLDLVGATAWGYDVLVHLGDGLGGFGHRDQIYNGDGEPTRLILRDFNNDEKPDLAVNAPDEGIILIYLNNGQGGFIVPAEELTGLPRCFGLDSGDFNGDGNLDLVTATIPSGHIPGDGVTFVLLGNGLGGFSESSEMNVDPLPTSVKVADLNNDGKPDFIVAGAQPTNTSGNYFTTFLGDGTGHFTQKQTTNLGTGSLKGEISIGDFNEDGKPDLAYPVTGGQVQHIHSQTVLIFFGDGTGNMTAGPTLNVGQEPHTVITPDFNKDGHLDLAVSNRTDGTISLFLGDGKGNFTLSVTRSVVSSELDP
jgi:FG-GAP-like repeat